MKGLSLFSSSCERIWLYFGQMGKANEKLFYAVGVGRRIGIYNTWNECKNQVEGVPNPKFRKFFSLSEAEEFVKYWKEKQSTSNSLTNDEIISISPSKLNMDNTDGECSKTLKTEKVVPDTLKHRKRNSENDGTDFKHLQEKIDYCEKKTDLYINQLSNILCGLKEMKNEFGKLSKECKNYTATKRLKLDKTSCNEPTSSKEKSTSPKCEDVDLFESTSLSNNDNNISEEITIEDFDFTELHESENPVSRKRLNSVQNAVEEGYKRLKRKVCRNSQKDSVPFTRDKDDYVLVYTDGSCLKNGNSNARAGIGIWFGEGHPLNVSEPVRGVQPTNNNAEIQAARIAMEIALKANISKLKIMTDSQFLINAVTEWMPKWKRNNWITSSNKHVQNRTELEKLDKVMSLLSVRWEKVSAHTGIRGNEAADRLANAGAAQN